jgi:hypothetical protein
VYSSVENMTNPSTDTDALHVIQDGYGLAISDYLGADMPCYQSIQTDLQAGMDLNGSEVRFPAIFSPSHIHLQYIFQSQILPHLCHL